MYLSSSLITALLLGQRLIGATSQSQGVPPQSQQLTICDIPSFVGFTDSNSEEAGPVAQRTVDPLLPELQACWGSSSSCGQDPGLDGNNEEFVAPLEEYFFEVDSQDAAEYDHEDFDDDREPLVDASGESLIPSMEGQEY